MSTEVKGETADEFDIEYSFTHIPAERPTRDHPGADAELVDWRIYILLNGQRVEITEAELNYGRIIRYLTDEYIAELAEEAATKDDER